ncbi:tRNA lysidine(34) synthetase TilS [Sphingobium sufflavum]|uniref:tRNA lysidine(34) synthetase TilS n=1 Tax=Sphingobium sufflavum TaxID=1129547 RepID=UPI00389B087D
MGAFSGGLAALLGRAPREGERFGVAVSGGPDSLALLDLAGTVLPGQVEAATVDHGLRVEGTAEAAMVAEWCATLAIPHRTLRPAEPIGGSVQAQARAARYALLDGWMADRSLDWLLTAHHADDQLETMLMRLNRASGVSGLAGVRARRGRVLRPLLGVRKAVLEAHVRVRAIPHVTDPSNADDRFDRARLRGILAGVDWLDPVAASRSAQALADAEAAIEWSVEQLYLRHVAARGDTLVLTDTAMPHEYRRRILRRMVATLAPDAPEPRGEQIERAILQLSHGSKLSIGACVATGGSVWTIRRAPPRRSG